MDAKFWAALRRLCLSQNGFTRLLHVLGDPRRIPTILRSIANWAPGVTAVPGQVWVILRLLERLEPQ